MHVFICLVFVPLGLAALASLVWQSGPQSDDDWVEGESREPCFGFRAPLVRGRRLRAAPEVTK